MSITVPKPQPSRSRSASVCEPYRELIELGLSRGRNAKAIWQDLVDSRGFPAGYQSVQRFIGKLRSAGEPEARAVIQTAPGEEAQVDYGSGPMVRDPQTGKYRRTRLFVLTLGYSRKCVRLLVFRSTVRVLAELHEKAVRRLGGATRVMVLDNLREGVLTSDTYDPALNPYIKICSSTTVSPLCPARVRHLDRKGKVESSVGHAKKTQLKGCTSRAWKRRKGIWIVRKTAGPIRAFKALPSARWRLCLPNNRLLCCRCRSNRFAITSTASVRCTWMDVWKSRPLTTAHRQAGLAVGFMCNGMTHTSGLIDPRNGQLLREHLRQERGRHRIQDEDRGRKTPRSTERLLRRAELTGAHIGVLCQVMYREEGQVAVRRILGVLALVKKYGFASTEDACAVALKSGACKIRFVRRYLEHHPQLALSLRQVDPLIRQLTLYRDLIEKRTRQENDSCTL